MREKEGKGRTPKLSLDAALAGVTEKLTGEGLMAGPRVVEAGLCGWTAADGRPRPSVAATTLRDRLKSIRSAVLARLTSSR